MPTPPLTLTPAELAAVVRRLGRGQSLVACLRRIAQQRAIHQQIPLTLDRHQDQGQTREY
jgi:hypothetical protein